MDKFRVKVIGNSGAFAGLEAAVSDYLNAPEMVTRFELVTISYADSQDYASCIIVHKLKE